MSARLQASRALDAPTPNRVEATDPGRRTAAGVGRVAWWLLFVTSAFFALFAIAAAGGEAASWLAGAQRSMRGSPPAFVLHAVTGAVALLIAPLQLSRTLRRRRPALHRRLGRVYAWSVWITSIATVFTTLAFRIAPAAKVMFLLVSALWFLTTLLAVRYAQRGDRATHERWAVRSVALAFFFVTFTPWQSALQSLGYSRDTSYAVGVLLAWGLNLVVAEVWLRRRRDELPARG